MIEKMSFVSIACRKSDIDDVIGRYLTKYEIQLENSLTELKSAKFLLPNSDENPYREILQKAEALAGVIPSGRVDGKTGKADGKAGRSSRKTADISPEESTESQKMSVDDARAAILEISENAAAFDDEIKSLNSRLDSLKGTLDLIKPFRSFDMNMKEISEMKYISFRFGRIPRANWNNFSSFLDDDQNFIFVNCQMDPYFVYGAYFSIASVDEKAKEVLENLAFEEITVPAKYSQSPTKAYSEIKDEIAGLSEQIEQAKQKKEDFLSDEANRILPALSALKAADERFDLRKLAGYTRHGGVNFCVFCGWMSARDAKKLKEETEGDTNVIFVIDDDFSSTYEQPPTKLKNPKLFRPFEMFVNMYGLPAYNEFDPTIFVSITYALIFGVMFGDLGQGLCLFAGGLLVYKLMKMDIGAIVSVAGLFSAFFGLMFGSVFGFEDIIPAIWMRPLSAMMTLPFVGKINTILIIAFCFGAFMIIVTMIINILSAIKSKNVGEALFGPNALTGLVFYGSLAAVIVLYMTGHTLPGTAVLVVMFVVPLVLLFLEEPIKNIIARKKPIEDSVGIFCATAFFELFEYLLSYFSNSMSFLRIGVFAISHAAMMEVVLTLAGAESGSANIAVMIIGNIIVLCLEGLVVGIQVLRLEYYEFFGRFYKGNGRPFKPLNKSS